MNKLEAVEALLGAGYRVVSRQFGLVGGLEFKKLGDSEIEIITKGYFWLVDVGDSWNVEIPCRIGQEIDITEHKTLESAVEQLVEFAKEELNDPDVSDGSVHPRCNGEESSS